MRTNWVPSLASLIAASGCLAPAPDELESRTGSIVAGTVDTGDPAVVELLALQGNTGVRCTATLVTPRVLLTAAHCVSEKGWRYYLFLRPNDRGFGLQDLVPVATVAYDPLYDNEPSHGHDLGVVVMPMPLPMRPVPMNRAPLTAPVIGKPARYVGYGLSNGVTQTGDGVKREGTAPIAGLDGKVVHFAPDPHGLCEGDSGGPLLMDFGSGEILIGVASYGNDGTCRGDSYFQRLDTQIAFVDEQIKKHDPGYAPADAGTPPSTMDASAPDSASAPDAGAPDTAPAPQPDTAPPDAAPMTGRRDAAAKPPTARPTPDADPEDEHVMQSFAGGTCAMAGGTPRAPAALWLALLPLAIACARTWRRRR